MKTIEQLLALSKNPYYHFSPEEEKKLNDFLSKKKAKGSKKSAGSYSKNSDKDTPVTADEDDERQSSGDSVKVRNLVPKTIPGVKESGQ